MCSSTLIIARDMHVCTYVYISRSPGLLRAAHTCFAAENG